MLREKLYELKNWREVVHTTWNPDGPGVIRVHMVPPKFTLFQTPPSVAILNGQELLPVNESWAILLTEFVRGVNAHGPGAMSDETLDGIMQDAFHRVRAVYPEVSDEMLRDDLYTIVETFESVIHGEIPDEEIGMMTLKEYAPYMTAPHRMDLMISAMTKDGKWHCNQRCVHCYAAGQTLAEVKELSTEEWKTVIRKCRSARIPQLTFTGGEPTMREDLPELVSEARWFVTRLNTNGVLMTKELAAALMKAELDSAQITLYSADEDIHNRLVGADNWKRSVEGLKNALAAGLNVSVNTPLSTLNSDYSRMLAFLKGLGVEYATCSGLIVTGNAEGHLSRSMQLSPEDILDAVRQAASYAAANNIELSFTSPGWIPPEELMEMGLSAPDCGAALSNMAVTPDGRVVPCQSWLSGGSLGNMLTDSWKKIWNGHACRKIREATVASANVCPLRSMADQKSSGGGLKTC